MAQKEWITKQKRKKGVVWVFHWYITKPETGKKAEQTAVIGALADFPSEKAAWREVDRRQLKPKQSQGAVRSGPLTFADLATSYIETGMTKLAFTTQYTYKHLINDFLVPRWGNVDALEIQPLDIEQRLGTIKRANPTKDKIRRAMSVIYTRAQKYGLIPRTDSSNPVKWVEQSAKSSYKPLVLEPATAAKIFDHLSGCELTVTILVAATGIRISEALGLKWEDIDFQSKQINLRRVYVSDRVMEKMKTEDSEAPVPLTDLLAKYLRAWHGRRCMDAPAIGFSQVSGQEERSQDQPAF